MTNLVILSLTLLAGNQARIEYVAPTAGTIFVDARSSLSEPWRNGWANSRILAGTNQISVLLPNKTAGMFRLRLQNP